MVKITIKVDLEEQSKSVVAKVHCEAELDNGESLTENYIKTEGQKVLMESELLMNNAMGLSKALTNLKLQGKQF